MARRTGYEPAWESDSSLGRHQLELEERVELLLFLNAHDHRTLVQWSGSSSPLQTDPLPAVEVLTGGLRNSNKTC